jgi:PAS domain S-box-containing protein
MSESSSFARLLPPRPLRAYLVAVALPVAVGLLTRAIRQSFAPGATPAFGAAVALAALYGGWGPGLVATLLGAAGYFMFPGLLEGAEGLTRGVQYVIVSLALTWMSGMVHRQRWLAVGRAEENIRLRHHAEEAAARAEAATHAARQEAARAEGLVEEASASAREAADALTSLATAEQMRADLHQANAQFAAIVASSTDAIVSKTLEGTILSWNPAAERIFGYTAEEMVGGSIFRLVPEEYHQSEREVLDRLAQGEVVTASEVERVRKDGERIWISLSSSPVRDDTGRIIGAASIKRDVTESRQAAERLREAQRLRAIGQLAGGIAHEANNQMLVVLGAAHFLLRQAGLNEAARADIRAIVQAAERTAGITQQLLAFGRRQTLRLENRELDPVVAGFQPILRRTLAENHVLALTLDAAGAVARLDPRQLEQILLNLTLNARDAMPDGGRLTIATRIVQEPDGGQYVCLAVTDTGCGMEPETLERAFEPFFTTKDVGQGTGLGLSVVEGIVSQSGGFLRVASAPDHGTTFSLFFPVMEARAPAAPGPAASEGPGGDGRSILLAEDEDSVRDVAARVLVEAGYVVYQAAHGQEALDLLRALTRPVDLVVTDLGMPVMDGHVLGREVARDWPGLPVLYMSGYAETGGAAPLLPKPFTPEDLVRRVGALLAPAPVPEGVS